MLLFERVWSIMAGSYVVLFGGFGPFWRVQSEVKFNGAQMDYRLQTTAYRQTTLRV
jgi:hypothetical protein